MCIRDRPGTGQVSALLIPGTEQVSAVLIPGTGQAVLMVPGTVHISAVLIPDTVQVSAVLIPGTGQVSLSCTPPSCTAPQRVCCEYSLSTAHRASHADSKGKYSHFCKQDEQILR